MSYVVDDAVEVKRGGRWVPGEVTEVDALRFCFRVDVGGRRQWYDHGDSRVRPVRAARMPTVRAIEPDTEEAESFEAARERSAGTVRAIVEQPKPQTPRSRDHLAFVRSLPCSWCRRGAPLVEIQASHHGVHGHSIKASDLRAIPLCVECHHGHHTGEGLPKSKMNPDQTREWFKDKALDVHEAKAKAERGRAA